MIYIAPFIAIFDAATVYYGTRVVSRISASAAKDTTRWTVIRYSIYLWSVRLQNIFFEVDQEQLALYKRNRLLIKLLLITIFISTAATVGLFWSSWKIFSNLSEYKLAVDDSFIFVCVLLSALATGCAWISYYVTKRHVSDYRERFWLDLRELNFYSHSNFPNPVNFLKKENLESSRNRTSPSDGIPSVDPVYVSVAFFDDDSARRALQIYRTERHGQYQYLGLPEPNTMVVHRQDLSGLLDRLSEENYLPDRDFTVNPVLLAGQLSVGDRKRLRVRIGGLKSSSKLNDPEELDRRIKEAREKIESLRRTQIAE